jgi:anti-sigma factor RsiW
MMNCKKAFRLLSAYQDGELASGLNREMEAHLQGCLACRSEWQGLQGVVAGLRVLPAPDVDPFFTPRVMAGLPAAGPGKFRLLPAAAYALVFLAIFIGGFFLQLSSDGNAAVLPPKAATYSSVLLENQDLGLLAIHENTLALFERQEP